MAGLLISRQIIGNLRESAFPYFMEQWKLASMSFKLWGALSPTQENAPNITDSKKVNYIPFALLPKSLIVHGLVMNDSCIVYRRIMDDSCISHGLLDNYSITYEFFIE